MTKQTHLNFSEGMLNTFYDPKYNMNFQYLHKMECLRLKIKKSPFVNPFFYIFQQTINNNLY